MPVFVRMAIMVQIKLTITDFAVFLVNAYIAALTSTASSIVNVFWRGKQK